MCVLHTLSFLAIVQRTVSYKILKYFNLFQCVYFIKIKFSLYVNMAPNRNHNQQKCVVGICISINNLDHPLEFIALERAGNVLQLCYTIYFYGMLYQRDTVVAKIIRTPSTFKRFLLCSFTWLLKCL